MKTTRTTAEMATIIRDHIKYRRLRLIIIRDAHDPKYLDRIPAEAVWMFENDYAGHEFMGYYSTLPGEIDVMLA